MTKGKTHRPKALYQVAKVLWHLDIFRRSFRDLSGHACMADSCIFCALKELFSQLQFSNETALPPDALRRALAESFFDQQRFQLGFMDDAAECFENMLLRIHMHIAHGEAEDMCNARHCIPHQKFAMTLIEQSVCGSCGATSEPLSYTQMVHYVSTSTLVCQVRRNANRIPEPFGQLLHKAGNMGDVRVCPSACGATIQIGRTLMNRPEIVSIGLVWNSERPTLEHIMEVFSTIGTTLRLGDVFNTVMDSRWAETCVHNLVGVVTYYGKHYSTFFFHTKLRVWIYFDDATVREVGPRWDQVVEKCRKGRYQPLLLLYALPDGTPVNTENAPKQITPFYNDKKKPSQQVVRRSVTPSPEKPNVGNTRRAITPNPDGTFAQKPPLPRTYNEYQNLSVIQSSLYGEGKQVHRTLSNGSSSGVELSSSGEMNVPRRRDSGNWSGDRNSASSSSSTTMDNPYLYLVGKVPPGSPTRTKSDSSSGSSGVYDCGYDSYSLSSNDSSTMTTIQHLMKMGHLAKIPEDYSNTQQQPSQSCDVLCDEADQLLVKSRQLEDEHDLVLALALCNAAATKARAAMNAPYNNPQTLTLARMKHNTCIMRARSLHRRMTQSQNNQKDQPLEIRHTREGSSGSGRHSRQNSKDKGQHSRQNSRELLQQPEKTNTSKNIEIYATLPKKKDGLKKMSAISIENDEDYVLCEKSPRESRSLFSKAKKDNKVREKRSRSEDRNKITTKDFTIAPEIVSGKDTLKREKSKEEEKKDKDKTKKQHKIRRKLLMGGLIKRKNRSMPDLTDPNDDEKPSPTATVDDSKVGLNKNQENGICGYLSEGHLEFTGNSTNPNLERSKLMRKSFHSSAGKILTAAKVPPPPPLRTTSQLSKTKSNEGQKERPPYPLPTESFYQEYQNSLSYDNQPNMIVTRADVHQDNSNKDDVQNIDSGVDEVDCLPSHTTFQLDDLPPYPSPVGSAIHSRQPSEEFPPPPPPLDLSALEEHLVGKPPTPPPAPGSLLAQLQTKRQEILSQDPKLPNSETQQQQQQRSDMWLKELQAKQAALRMRKQSQDQGQDVVNTQRYAPGELEKKSSVKDLANKFESIKPLENYQNGVLSVKKREETPAALESAVEETKEEVKEEDGNKKNKIMKKKSVSFCDQVILVATAEEQEDDSFIPNPILERVLRSAMNKPETAAIRQEIFNLRENEAKKEDDYNDQSVYVRRNSIDLLTRPSSDTEYYNGTPNETPLRQSPYQKVPQTNYPNTQESYPQYPQQFPQPARLQEQYPRVTQDQYSSSPRNQDQYLPPQDQYVSRIQDPNSYSSPRISDQYSSGPKIQEAYSTSPRIQDQYSPSPKVPEQYPLHRNQEQYFITPQDPYSTNQRPQDPYSATQRPQDQYSVNQRTSQDQYVVNQRPQDQYSTNQRTPQDPYVVRTQDQYSPLPRPQEQFSRLPLDPHRSPYEQPPRVPVDQYRTQSNPDQYSRMPDSYSSSPRMNQDQYAPQQQMRVPDQYAPYKPSPEPYPSSPRIEHTPLQRTYPRQSPNPQSYSQYPVYQHPPSPVPSINSNYNYQQQQQHQQQQQQQQQQPYKQYPPYQRVPEPHRESGYVAYQRPPQEHQEPPNYNPYQPVPNMRVPPAHMDQDLYQYKNGIQNKQLLKKSVSFEPGTKAGSMEPPAPKAVITPIIVNNANNSVPMGKTKCNLCRKKVVVSSNLYCTDCEFYMSRFKPKT